MTPEQIEAEFKHVATKEDLGLLKADLGLLKADLHRELAVNTRWLIGIMITLQLPTWIGLLQIWSFLATIVGKLPK